MGCRIVLIEDNDDDVFLFERALAALGFPGELVRHASPTRAWLYFKETAAHAPPDLIVCDGVWEGDGASDLLAWLRAHPQYRAVPFFLHTGDSNTDRHENILRHGANGVFVKALQQEDTMAILRALLLSLPEPCHFWLK
jgi:CheY-like chemotaxis protein